ncbi:unnamed protein product [Polarella glacialis]|nr:unnamed protein product [Polarella glacialis]CAE8599128.1 unnamed protein product [Polarella glacialis]CAE8599129.1 unnamed protein product [Polarella glacialis]CAE8614746.1 unnamed protein product [Polarella glacialis]|mmetsp:Transcript_30775/g.49414  ORF Transcript_30775/g.49414 Transcript_30775/m.49414 type:complete len:159 (+) Transcript_30775:88-564(+)|eukprot:CAMPEP_0115080208 /NCGR_PEP_ID=MMETSP0227-20121206/18547_1 /TAXON_ID=89957 /ORGANISM="Polarella glacialis, Strain CCMP 1383" /LENGTH=158 /DNA_ID=CAMNT_0002467819 /DNA_START=79 /DNA_END=555 /DNA_ORIENTATION=-
MVRVLLRTSYDAEPEMLILTEPVGSVAELKDAVLDLHPHLDFYSMAIYDSQGDLADEADIVSMMETYSVEDQPAVPPSMGHVEANPENIDIEDQPAAVHDKALGDEPKGDQPDAQQAPMMRPYRPNPPVKQAVFDPYNDPATMQAAYMADAASHGHSH